MEFLLNLLASYPNRKDAMQHFILRENLSKIFFENWKDATI